MENHPIPQDVTGFQFKLIGDMTVKQFAYLAAGVVLAYLFFSSPFAWYIKWPFIFLFGFLGVALAFIPIEGRPFDVMLVNFLKALVSPTQFIFQKVGYSVIPLIQIDVKQPEKVQKAQQTQQQSKISVDKLQKYLSALPKTPRNSLDEKELRFLGTLPLQQTQQQSINPFSMPTIIGQAPVAQKTKTAETIVVASQPVIQQAPVAPHIVEQANTLGKAPDDMSSETLENESKILEQELTVAKQEEAKQQNTITSTQAHEKVVALEKELAEIFSQKQKLQNQLVTLKKELAAQKQNVFSPSVATAKQQTQNVRMVPQGLGKSVGLPITPDAPNLLTGIIKDPRNNTLPSILVEVKDKDGNAVRAFKTNGLGQFAAATPLPNGVYTLAFEDPQGKQKFDAIELPVNGAIIQPIEVISVDEREQLRQELFKT